MAAAAILNFTAFRYSDFGRFLVCYSPHETVPETVEKPFLAIFLGLNRIFTGLSKALSTLATTVAEFGDKLSPPFPASIVASVDRA